MELLDLAIGEGCRGIGILIKSSFHLETMDWRSKGNRWGWTREKGFPVFPA
jgi:hypothetical protein